MATSKVVNSLRVVDGWRGVDLGRNFRLGGLIVAADVVGGMVASWHFVSNFLVINYKASFI